MKTKELITVVCGAVFKVAFVVVAVFLIYRGATICYEYGYRVFAEPPVSADEGRMVTVTVTPDMTPKEIGTLFLSQGLIRDDRLFEWQYRLSEFAKTVKPGTFELSTSMTVEEMMEVMARKPVTEVETK